mgnify:CR=1 FL=1
MNMINPAKYTNDVRANTRDKWVVALANNLGIDAPVRPITAVDELRKTPAPLKVVQQAVREGLPLEQIKDDLILAYVAEAVTGRYGNQLDGFNRAVDDFEQRRASLEAPTHKAAKSAYAKASKALAKLPNDPFDRDAVFETDSTKEAKELITCIQSINLYTGIQGAAPHEASQSMAIARFVVIDPEAEGDLAGFLHLARKQEHDTAFVRALRGEFGEAVKGELPTREQVLANVEALQQVYNAQQRRANGVAISTAAPGQWKSGG